MTTFTKALATAIIISTAGVSTTAFAQDNTALTTSVKPTNSWLLTLMTPVKETGLQTLRTDISPQTEQMTPWTDRPLLVLAETPSEKYMKTNLSNFSYPVLGGIEYGVKPDPTTVAASNSSYQTSNFVSSSFSSNPYDQNTYRTGRTTSAQLRFKF